MDHYFSDVISKSGDPPLVRFAEPYSKKKETSVFENEQKPKTLGQQIFVVLSPLTSIYLLFGHIAAAIKPFKRPINIARLLSRSPKSE